MKQIFFRAARNQAAGADLPDLSTDHVTSIIYSICLQNVLLRVKYPEKQTLTFKCIRRILSSPYLFTLNSEHLILKKHLLANVCFEGQNVGIWRLNTMLGKNTFNQALKRNVTIVKWNLPLVKCLEVHLTSTMSILGRNDHFLQVMSRSCRTMS